MPPRPAARPVARSPRAGYCERGAGAGRQGHAGWIGGAASGAARRDPGGIDPERLHLRRRVRARSLRILPAGRRADTAAGRRRTGGHAAAGRRRRGPAAPGAPGRPCARARQRARSRPALLPPARHRPPGRRLDHHQRRGQRALRRRALRPALPRYLDRGHDPRLQLGSGRRRRRQRARLRRHPALPDDILRRDRGARLHARAAPAALGGRLVARPDLRRPRARRLPDPHAGRAARTRPDPGPQRRGAGRRSRSRHRRRLLGRGDR